MQCVVISGEVGSEGRKGWGGGGGGVTSRAV